MTKTEFNIVNIYKHRQYFDRLLSVTPANALRLHTLLMEKMNSSTSNRKQNTLRATPTDDAMKLGISRSMYQKYKAALINAGIWVYDDRFRNHHRIAGDWHIAEDLLDDPIRLVSSDDTSRNADIPTVDLNQSRKKDSNSELLVSSHYTSKQDGKDLLVSSDNTSKNADISTNNGSQQNKNRDKNTTLVSSHYTRVVSSHYTYIYSIIYIDTIDDDDTTAIYNYLVKDGYRFRYNGKVLQKQLSDFKRIYNKLPPEQRKTIFEKMYYSVEKPEKDTLNYLIECGKNQLKHNNMRTKKTNNYVQPKHIEKGTDWSKKKVKKINGPSTNELKEIFSKLNNKR